MSGFEPERGLGKEFPQVVGVTGANIVSDARGAEPLWKFAPGKFGFQGEARNPSLSGLYEFCPAVNPSTNCSIATSAFVRPVFIA